MDPGHMSPKTSQDPKKTPTQQGSGAILGNGPAGCWGVG